MAPRWAAVKAATWVMSMPASSVRVIAAICWGVKASSASVVIALIWAPLRAPTSATPSDGICPAVNWPKCDGTRATTWSVLSTASCEGVMERSCQLSSTAMCVGLSADTWVGVRATNCCEVNISIWSGRNCVNCDSDIACNALGSSPGMAASARARSCPEVSASTWATVRPWDWLASSVAMTAVDRLPSS